MKTLKRRRKEHKTDYRKRFKLLKSGTPRVVFRKTNKYLISQYVLSLEAQDKTIFSVCSKDLVKYNWPESKKGSLKSIPAAYLTGYLIGIKILEKKMDTPILDFGMARVLHKSKTYAFIKGLIDSGVNIKCEEKNFPDSQRINGKHMKNEIPFEKIKTKIK